MSILVNLIQPRSSEYDEKQEEKTDSAPDVKNTKNP
jgi:hypothetical protein